MGITRLQGWNLKNEYDVARKQAGKKKKVYKEETKGCETTEMASADP